MKTRALWSALCLSVLAGCATEANFTKALEGSAKLTAATKLVTSEAERDAIKANLLHLYAQNIKVADIVCSRALAIEAAGTALDAFGDAIDTIHKVGEKPADTSYASYVAQFRKNAKNIAAAKTMGLQSAIDAAETETQQRRAKADLRCAQLYAADTVAVLGPTAPGIQPNAAAGFATLFAFNELIKSGMAAAENVQRETAVVETAKALLPGLERARQSLARKITTDFKPFVQYSGLAAAHPAIASNTTLLGGTVTLHRWFIAQQIAQSSQVVANCTVACLGDPAMRKNLDDLTSAVEQYRALAEVDPTEIIDALDEGIANARKAADGKANWAQVLDGLLLIADTVSGLGEKFGDYKSSRE